MRRHRRWLIGCWWALLAGTPCQAATDIAWIWPSSDAPPASAYPEVAVLVDTLLFKGADVERWPRRRALVMPSPSVKVTPVVHVQSGAASADAFSEAQRKAVLQALDRAVSGATAGWVQLDFEAPSRQREAYLSLVREARHRLPTSVRLSVTVLVSWCTQGNWLDRLAADELVPMWYRMGVPVELDAPALHARCRGPAAGFSLQEPPKQAVRSRFTRRFWFNERNWTADTAERTPR